MIRCREARAGEYILGLVHSWRLPLLTRRPTTVPASNTSRVLSKYLPEVRQWPKEFVCNEGQGGAFLEAGPHSACGTVIGCPDQRVPQAKTPCSSGTRRGRRARRARRVPGSETRLGSLSGVSDVLDSALHATPLPRYAWMLEMNCLSRASQPRAQSKLRFVCSAVVSQQ